MTESQLQKIVRDEITLMRLSVAAIRDALDEIEETPDIKAVKVETDIIANEVFLLDRWQAKLNASV